MSSAASSPSHTILQGLNENTILLPYFNYTFVLPLERNFESKEYVNSLRLWMISNWSNSILYAIAYIISIFIGQAYMNNKQKYELRTSLALWNILLGLFSTIGAIRVIPELIHSIINNGIEYSICDNSFAYGITGF
jgi:elongation of very long chain fatty acids protein 6